MCQNIAQLINRDDNEKGKVWQNRYKSVRLLDEASLLACAAYVDLNPIQAAIAEALEQSDYTSIQRRIQALKEGMEAELLGGEPCPNASQAMVSLVADATHDQVESTLKPGSVQQAHSSALQTRCISGGAESHKVADDDTKSKAQKTKKRHKSFVLGADDASCHTLALAIKAEGTGVEPATVSSD